MEEVRFIEVNVSYGVHILYLNTTRVMYALTGNGRDNVGSLTLLRNPDGSPMVWREGDNENYCVCCGTQIPEGRQVCFACETCAKVGEG